MATRQAGSSSTKAHRGTNSAGSGAGKARGSAHKTGGRTAHGRAWTDKRSANASSTGHGRAKKEPAKQSTRCWPGYEPVPGTKRGAKGSCKPKARQTSAERKSDAMAAAASKLRKGGSKAGAKRSR